MESVGLRELKQNPSRVIAHVEQGASVQVTVQGRPAAIITPISRARRRSITAEEFHTVFQPSGGDAEWAEELHASRDNDPLVDPWEGHQ